MDWNLMISALAGLITGGGVSWLFRLREDKAGSQADAIDKAADAMRKLLENAERQQDVFNKIIGEKNSVISQQSELLGEYKKTFDELKQQLKEFQYKSLEDRRKIEGMQKTINSEIRKRKAAETDICLMDDCNRRRPPRGTEKKEQHDF